MQRIPPFKTLDIFRGFAAIWVVMVHSCDRWLFNGNTAYLRVPLYAFSMRGQLGVMIFFVISGYCVTAAAYAALVSGKSIWRYCFERIRRIYPPYLAALVLTVLGALVISFASSHHLVGEVHHLQSLQSDPKFWIANLFLLQGELNTPMVNVVSWSLCYEVAFYAVIGVFLKVAQRIAARRDLYAATIFFVCAVGVSTIISLSILLAFGKPNFPFDSWHQFSIGGILFFMLDLRPDTMKAFTPRLRQIVLANATLVALLTLLFLIFRRMGGEDIGHQSSRAQSLTCLLFALLLIGLHRIDSKVAALPILRPLKWVGVFSYSLYLVHPIVLPFVDIICRNAGLNGPFYWIAFWIQVAVAIAFGRLFYVLIERHFVSKWRVKPLEVDHIA